MEEEWVDHIWLREKVDDYLDWEQAVTAQS
jgi:hypothetical protein